MDVHPPHEPVHTWRDALTHLAIVTVGLFIALMLEGVVEYIHHRELVREARANIRQEFEDNDKAVQDDVANVTRESDMIRADVKTLRLMQAGPPGRRSLSFTFSFEDLDDAAFQSARDTGALSFMPYADVQTYADLYSLQRKVNSQMFSIVQRETESFAPITTGDDEAKIPSAQYDEMIRESGVALVDLYTLNQYLRELDQQYLAALKKS